jgi:hypothetical protein
MSAIWVESWSCPQSSISVADRDLSFWLALPRAQLFDWKRSREARCFHASLPGIQDHDVLGVFRVESTAIWTRVVITRLPGSIVAPSRSQRQSVGFGMTEEISFDCRASVSTVSLTSVTRGQVVYPFDPEAFDAIWRSATARDCLTQDTAIDGRALGPATMTIALRDGDKRVGWAASSSDWKPVIEALESTLAGARSRFPDPLPSCCNARAPCSDSELGVSCWSGSR